MTLSEHQIQRGMVNWLAMALPGNAYVFAVPNGGARNRITAANLKKEGVKAGVPDLCIVHNGRALFAEVKTPKGRPSDTQRHVHARLERAGAPTAIVRSIDDLQAFLLEQGVALKVAA